VRRDAAGAGALTPLETVPCAVCASDEVVPARLRVPRDDDAVQLGLPGARSHWVVCRRCGLVFQSPRPDADAVDRLYVGGTYHENRGGVPEHYVQYSLRRSRAALAWGLSLPALRGITGRALDIGCGIGGALVALRERGWDVVGAEPDPVMAEVGRERFGLDIRTGFFDESVLAGESFELAYSCHVWEHLADPVAVARAAHTVLRPAGGFLFIVVPTFRRARTLAWGSFTAPHTYMFTDVSLGNIVRAAGFDVVGSRFAAGADSELWLVARAVERDAPMTGFDVDDPDDVQRELLTIPLRVPLGVPGRVRAHARTLAEDPAAFGIRLARWSRVRVHRARVAAGGDPGT